MVVLTIKKHVWYSSGEMHYTRNNAIMIRDIFRKRGMRARIIIRGKKGNQFWLVFVDKDVDWIYDVDRSIEG